MEINDFEYVVWQIHYPSLDGEGPPLLELFLLYSAAICYVCHCGGGRRGGGPARIFLQATEHYVTLNRIFNHNILSLFVARVAPPFACPDKRTCDPFAEMSDLRAGRFYFYAILLPEIVIKRRFCGSMVFNI